MRKTFFALLVLAFLASCSNRRIELTYVWDDSLSLGYLDDTIAYDIESNWAGGSVDSPEVALEILRPLLIGHDEAGIVDLKEEIPFHIKLINDSVWLVVGQLTWPDDVLVIFGGVHYAEIRKDDGKILKFFVEE